MIKSESLKQLAPALLKAQQEMGVALKDSKNPFFKSSYADLNAVIDATVPVLNSNKIAVLQSPGTNAAGKPVIQTIFLHESGEFVASENEVVAAKANDPQAAGSATTYARRYGLQAMATLKAEDDDGEKAMGRGTASAGAGKSMPKLSTPIVGASSVTTTADTNNGSTGTAPAKKVSFSNKFNKSSGDEI